MGTYSGDRTIMRVPTHFLAQNRGRGLAKRFVESMVSKELTSSTSKSARITEGKS